MKPREVGVGKPRPLPSSEPSHLLLRLQLQQHQSNPSSLLFPFFHPFSSSSPPSSRFSSPPLPFPASSSPFFFSSNSQCVSSSLFSQSSSLAFQEPAALPCPPAGRGKTSFAVLSSRDRRRTPRQNTLAETERRGSERWKDEESIANASENVDQEEEEERKPRDISSSSLKNKNKQRGDPDPRRNEVQDDRETTAKNEQDRERIEREEEEEPPSSSSLETSPYLPLSPKSFASSSSSQEKNVPNCVLEKTAETAESTEAGKQYDKEEEEEEEEEEDKMTLEKKERDALLLHHLYPRLDLSTTTAGSARGSKGSTSAEAERLKGEEEEKAAKKKKKGRSFLSQYTLGDTIGEGTFGKVKLARHVLTQESVAVKILEKSRIKETGDIERVVREIHILKTIQHPHIVRLLEVSLAEKEEERQQKTD